MTAPALPAERAFATGHQGKTLVLMVCGGWVWAGLYSSPFSITPLQIAVVPRLSASTETRVLIIGSERFLMTHASLQAARRWLDRSGVSVRVRYPRGSSTGLGQTTGLRKSTHG